MRDYAITTDSSCDFDQALADSLGVTVVPLSVQIGPRRFRNAPGEAMDSHSFYQLLSQGELAQTSAPNVEEFKAVWRPILQSGRDLLYLGFSSGLSGTYHNAAIAAEDLREEFPEARIITVDTLCASLGQGMLVDLTVQEKRQGKTLDEVAAFAEKNRLYLCHWFTVGDLSQLRRGGRLSAGKAIVGNLLNIKPVLHVDDEGHLVPMASARAGRNPSRPWSATWRRAPLPRSSSASTSATATVWPTPSCWPKWFGTGSTSPPSPSGMSAPSSGRTPAWVPWPSSSWGPTDKGGPISKGGRSLPI